MSDTVKKYLKIVISITFLILVFYIVNYFIKQNTIKILPSSNFTGYQGTKMGERKEFNYNKSIAFNHDKSLIDLFNNDKVEFIRQLYDLKKLSDDISVKEGILVIPEGVYKIPAEKGSNTYHWKEEYETLFTLIFKTSKPKNEHLMVELNNSFFDLSYGYNSKEGLLLNIIYYE